MPRPARLIVYCLLLAPIMAWLIPFAVGRFGPARGMAGVMMLYWFGFCLPFGIAFGAHRRLRLAAPPRAVALAIGLPALTLIAAMILPSAPMTPQLWALALAGAALNGPLEEFFWRGAFLQTFPESARMQAVGVGLFTMWHLPLSMAPGISFEGGGVALIAGAGALGAVWAWISWQGRSAGWAMISHALVNACLFPSLIALNA